MKDLAKIFFKLSRPKGNLCGGSGVTVLNYKYPRPSSRDTIKLVILFSSLIQTLALKSKLLIMIENGKRCFHCYVIF